MKISSHKQENLKKKLKGCFLYTNVNILNVVEIAYHQWMFLDYFTIWFFYLNRGQLILGYTEVELCTRGSGYQFIHAADILHCAESHIRSELEFLWPAWYTAHVLEHIKLFKNPLIPVCACGGQEPTCRREFSLPLCVPRINLS